MGMQDCIVPQRKRTWAGYMMMKFNGKYESVHRVSWKLLNGDIPKGIVIDHECHNQALRNGECKGGNSCQHRACINPEHLRAISHLENVQAGARKLENNTHCKYGHLVSENLAYRSTGLAYCQSCRKADNAKSAAKRKVSA